MFECVLWNSLKEWTDIEMKNKQAKKQNVNQTLKQNEIRFKI